MCYVSSIFPLYKAAMLCMLWRGVQLFSEGWTTNQSYSLQYCEEFRELYDNCVGTDASSVCAEHEIMDKDVVVNLQVLQLRSKIDCVDVYLLLLVYVINTCLLMVLYFLSFL